MVEIAYRIVDIVTYEPPFKTVTVGKHCARCSGSGKRGDRRCKNCGGSGRGIPTNIEVSQ